MQRNIVRVDFEPIRQRLQDPIIYSRMYAEFMGDVYLWARDKDLYPGFYPINPRVDLFCFDTHKQAQMFELWSQVQGFYVDVVDSDDWTHINFVDYRTIHEE